MSDIAHHFGYVDVTGDDGKPRKEMALGIKRAAMGKQPIFAIPLSSAWMYNEPEYMAGRCFAIADFLGMFPDAFLMKRIANLILNYLPDLVASKPYENSEQGSECGVGAIIINGEKQHFAMTNTGRIIH